MLFLHLGDDEVGANGASGNIEDESTKAVLIVTDAIEKAERDFAEKFQALLAKIRDKMHILSYAYEDDGSFKPLSEKLEIPLDRIHSLPIDIKKLSKIL